MRFLKKFGPNNSSAINQLARTAMNHPKELSGDTTRNHLTRHKYKGGL